MGQSSLFIIALIQLWVVKNLVWAPNRIKGQHGIDALQQVINKIKDADAFGRDAVIDALKEWVKQMLNGDSYYGLDNQTLAKELYSAISHSETNKVQEIIKARRSTGESYALRQAGIKTA